MVFTVADRIVRLRRDATRRAGTLISTRTPAGVGFSRPPPAFLAAGDRDNIEFEGIDRQTNLVDAA